MGELATLIHRANPSLHGGPHTTSSTPDASTFSVIVILCVCVTSSRSLTYLLLVHIITGVNLAFIFNLTGEQKSQKCSQFNSLLNKDCCRRVEPSYRVTSADETYISFLAWYHGALGGPLLVWRI